MTKNILCSLLLLSGLTFIPGCTKKEDLHELDTSKNIFDPENNAIDNLFVLDSISGNAYPYAQLYYHIRYDLIPNTSSIYKIAILRDGSRVLGLLPSQPNIYNPRDLTVSRFTTYAYSFAFEETDGTLSGTSRSYYVHIP